MSLKAVFDIESNVLASLSLLNEIDLRQIKYKYLLLSLMKLDRLIFTFLFLFLLGNTILNVILAFFLKIFMYFKNGEEMLFGPIFLPYI